MKRALILFVALALAAGALAAGAQTAPVVKPAAKPVTGQHDNNAPITISSDSFQADLNAKSATYTGNVIVTQADMKLRIPRP